MSPIDVAILSFITFGLIIGLWRGLVFELFTLTALPVSFGVTYIFHDQIMARLFGPSMSQEWHIAIYVVTFIVAFVVIYWICWLLYKMLKLTGMWTLDKTLGGIVGATKHALFLLVLLLGLVTYPVPRIIDALKQSKFVPYLIEGTWYIHQSFPEPYKSGTSRYLNSLNTLQNTPEFPPEIQDE